MSAERKALGQLLRAELDRTGESGRAFATRAQLAGHSISHTTVYGILNGTRTKHDLATLDAIVDMTSLSERDVYESVDVPMPGPPFADELPEGLNLLDRRERRAVVELLTVMVRRAKVGQVVDEPDVAAGE